MVARVNIGYPVDAFLLLAVIASVAVIVAKTYLFDLQAPRVRYNHSLILF